MKKRFFLIIFPFLLQAQSIFAQQNIPQLVKKGDHYQLVVNGEPFLILGGELGNSTASTMESMESVWQRLEDMNLNTVLMPVYWELLEPEEGKYDFPLVDNLILEARKHNLKLSHAP